MFIAYRHQSPARHHDVDSGAKPPELTRIKKDQQALSISVSYAQPPIDL
jgi:hypothetical protein